MRFFSVLSQESLTQPLPGHPKSLYIEETASFISQVW